MGAQQAQAWALGHARGARTGARRTDGQALGVQGRAGRLWAQAAGTGEREERNSRARGARRQLGGRRARGRAQQAWARSALGVGARGVGPGRGLGAGRATWAPGQARAVHSVHSACF